MTMDSKEETGNNCQLRTRHWEIRPENGVPEVVDGPGVIGEYPKMFPGANFQYQSCCPLSTPRGQMGGSFKMFRPDGNSFDAVVPTWQFAIPDVIVDLDTDDGPKQGESRS